MIAPNLASSLAILFESENKSQFKVLKDHNSIRMDGCLINRGHQLLYIVLFKLLEIVLNPLN